MLGTSLSGRQSRLHSEPQRLTWQAGGSPSFLRRLEDPETATDWRGSLGWLFAPHEPKLIRLGRPWQRSQPSQQGGSLKCLGDTMGR